MPFDVLLSLLGIATAAAWTPGPNNALVASSGARFGLQRTAPHIAGIFIGFPVMIFCISLGLGQLFQQYAVLQEILRYAGIILLLFLAWSIATSTSPAKSNRVEKPFTFLQAAAFQWINPKAWIMAIGISAQFVTKDAPITTALIVSAVFLLVGFGSACTWAMSGAALQGWLAKGRRLLIFNLITAALILSGVVVLFFAELA